MSHPKTTEPIYVKESSGYDRALGFFDAIYGFSATLLIANVETPSASAWQSVDALLSHGMASDLIGFLISFAVIGVFWRTNHRLLNQVEAFDSALISLNMLIAGMVVFIPFSTRAMSDHQTADLPLPTALYAMNIVAIVVVQLSMQEIGIRRGRIIPDDEYGKIPTLIDNLVVPVVFLISIPVAYAVDGIAAKYVWIIAAVLTPITGLWAAHRRQARDQKHHPEVRNDYRK